MCWLGVGVVFIMFGFGCVLSEVWLLVGLRGVGLELVVFWGVSFGFPGCADFRCFSCFRGRICVDRG